MNFRVPAVVLICSLLLTGIAHAEPNTVRVLTIGNSFADNALTYLPKLAEAAGNKLVYAKANLGGCTMKRHWDHVEKYEADHSDKAGSPYGSGRSSLAQQLTKDTWDVVTIQQVSYHSHDLGSYRPYARNLHDYIREHAPQARALLHQIWAYRVDDPWFKPENEGRAPHTQQVMYEQVRANYHTIAKELGIDILPSGDAMYLADRDPEWGFKPDTTFDFGNAAKPDLPDQTHSLHTGYSWRKQKDGSFRLGMDGHHASQAGKYLIGCVWFEVLFGQSVIENPYVPKGIDADYARFLQETAHRSVTELRAGN